MFTGISLAQPWFLLLLLLVPPMLYFSLKYEKRKGAGVSIPGAEAGKKVSLKIAWLRFLPFFRALALMALIIALARPQSSYSVQDIDSEGIDIMMATDLSLSMYAEDFKPNRLEAARKLGIEFINNRPGDRIGLVVFSGESFTLCPLTIDHHFVIDQLSKVKTGFLQDGTAIGMGLAACVNRLRESKAKTRIVILLTDGGNNAGTIDPLTAAQLAVKYHVKVYSIGIGSINGGYLPLPGYRGNIPSDIDETMLQKISSLTGGRYFRATDNAALKSIYTEIDKLEKVKIQSHVYQEHTEEFAPWLIAAFIFIGIEFLSRYVFLKTITV